MGGHGLEDILDIVGAQGDDLAVAEGGEKVAVDDSAVLLPRVLAELGGQAAVEELACEVSERRGAFGDVVARLMLRAQCVELGADLGAGATGRSSAPGLSVAGVPGGQGFEECE